MAEPKKPSKTFSLRPWPTAIKNDESLKTTTARMHAKYGGFRHITEQGLRNEIVELQTSGNNDTEEPDVTEAEKLENQKGSMEYIAAQKQKMAKYVGTALNETLMMLDFTSLLVSKYQPKQGQSTMSPHLKEKVPLGSLGIDIWEDMPPQPLEKLEDEERIAKGWLMQNLEKSVTSLSNAANRLKRDAETETKFWSQIEKVRGNDWPIFKNPRDPRYLGVQVASIEAAHTIREQGLLTFKADSDGTITLKDRIPKSIRVRYDIGGKVISSSKILESLINSNDSLEQYVLKSRDTLFEEELFTEMMYESRNMLSLGVKVLKDVIYIPLPLQTFISFQTKPEQGSESESESESEAESKSKPQLKSESRALLIDLISPTEVEDTKLEEAPNEFVQSIALALRLLLSSVHHQRYLRRTARPLPLSDNKPPPPSPAIIRPLLTSLRHQNSANKLLNFIDNLSVCLKAAGCSISYEQDLPESKNNIYRTSQIIISPPSIPTAVADGPNIKVTLTTTLARPPFTTYFTLTLSPEVAKCLDEEYEQNAYIIETENVDMAIDMVAEIVTLDITHNLLQHGVSGDLGDWTAMPGQAAVIKGSEDVIASGKQTLEVQVRSDGSLCSVQLVCSHRNVATRFVWTSGNSEEQFTLLDRAKEYAEMCNDKVIK